MATRYDAGTLNQPHETKEGYLFCEAVFARDGILEYRLPGGKVRRELRLPETNSCEDTLVSYGSKPVTIEHPPVLLDSANSKNYQVGTSDPVPIYEKRYDKGFVGGIVRIFNADAVGLVKSKKKQEISIGYTCDVDNTPGIWNGEHYDAIQRNVQVNHIAITEKGRAGPEVRLRLDSSNDIAVHFLSEEKKDTFSSSLSTPHPKKRMTTVRHDSLEFQDVPESFALYANQKFKELEQAIRRGDSFEAGFSEKDAEVGQLYQRIMELENERDRAVGRADALEIELEEARWDKSSKADEMMDDEEEEEEEEMPPKAKKSKKKCAECSKHDSADEPEEDGDEEDEEDEDEERDDSVSDRLNAWMEAESVIPGITRSDSYTSDLSTSQIRALVVNKFEPELKLDSASSAYIQGRYDYWMAKQSTTSRQDSIRNDYTKELQAVAGLAQQPGLSASDIQRARIEATSKAYMEPLALHK